MNEQPIIENITCTCGTMFQWERFENELGEKFDSMFRPKLCDPCQAITDKEVERIESERIERKRREDREAAITRLTEKLDCRTPDRYKATDIRHPGFNLNLWNRVKAWRPTPEAPWLGLVDVSGESKTRIGYLLLREIVLASISDNGGRPMSFEIATAYELSEAVRNQYSKRMPDVRGMHDDYTVGEKARAYIDRMATAGILLFDDLGKAKNTPAVSAELFAIIDRRHAENLATIWTANSAPNEIVAGMSADLAGPLAGRLIECSQIITA